MAIQRRMGAIDAEVIGKDEAEALTDAIRDALDAADAAQVELFRLVGRAHKARVWQHMEYGSWDAYLEGEFGMSRSAGYRLTDLEHVQSMLELAAGVHLKAISARAATELKSDLDVVVEQVADAVKDLPEAERSAAAEQEITKARKSHKSVPRRETSRSESGKGEAASPEPARERPDPPPAEPATGAAALDEPAGDAGPPTTASLEQSTHDRFELFFKADPVKVALMDDLREGKRRHALARRWVDKYELAVKGAYSGPAIVKPEPDCQHAKKSMKGPMMICDTCGAVKVGANWRKKAS